MLVFWIGCSGPVNADGRSSDETARLAAGEAVAIIDADTSGEADALIDGAVDVQAPPAVVWDVLVDCAHAPAVMPNLIACKILQSDPAGKWDVREHRIRWISLLPELRVEFHAEYDPRKAIRFRRTAGDMRVLDGAWQLMPSRNGTATRLTYQSRVGFGPMIPGFMIRSALSKDVPGFLSAIRTEAERLAKPRDSAQK